MSKSSNKGLILGLSSLAVAAAGIGYYLLQKQEKSSSRSHAHEGHLDRATTIRILKELKKEMFTVFQNFAAVSQNIKQQSMGRARPEDIKMMLLEQPMFRGEIENVEEAVYSLFNVSKEQFQRQCELYYREDPEVKALQKSMKDQFDQAFTGVSPDPKTEIPTFMTPQLTFTILERVMTESALKLNEKLLELQEQGEQINLQNPKMMEIMQSLKMDNSKKEILREYGLDQFEDAGSKILQYATQIYSQQNKDNFNAKMQQLDTKYQGIMEQILMQGPMAHEDLKKKMAAVTSSQSSKNMPFAGFAPRQDIQEDEFVEEDDQEKQDPQEKQEEQQPEKEKDEHEAKSEKAPVEAKPHAEVQEEKHKQVQEVAPDNHSNSLNSDQTEVIQHQQEQKIEKEEFQSAILEPEAPNHEHKEVFEQSAAEHIPKNE